MKLVLLFGIFISVNAFAAKENYSFKCSMTSIDGNIRPFNGRMIKKDNSAFTLMLNHSVIVSDTNEERVELKSMSCSDQSISADYQGTPFSDCIFYLKESDSISGRFLRLTWPSYDMLSLNLNKQVSVAKPQKTFSHLTYLEEVPYGMSGGEQPGKKITKLNCSVINR